MLTDLLEAIVSAIVGPLVKWLEGRKSARADAAAEVNRNAALSDSSALRDASDEAIEASHAQTDEALDHLHSDAAQPNSLRKQSDDAQRAIDSANDSVRGA
jgi:hypothetical protein